MARLRESQTKKQLMTKLLSFTKSIQPARRMLTVILALVQLCAFMPVAPARAQVASATSKLSGALQQSLTTNESQVWQDVSKQTVRMLIQTNGAVTSSLLKAIANSGGSVVRQFTSINGLLADLPKSKLLTIAARSDVERMSADHLAQQSASHIEAATGADRVRSYTSLTQSYTGLDGTGVGIAILDSGIMAGHSEFGASETCLGFRE